MECGHSPLVSIPRASAGRVGRPNAAATGPRKQRTETATGFKRSSGLSRKRCAGHRNRCAPSKWQPGLDGRGSYSKRKTNWLGKDESLIQDAVLTPVRSTQEFEVVLAEVLAATRPVLKSRMAFEIREGDPAPDYPGSMNKGKVVRCSGSGASARDGRRSWNSSRAERFMGTTVAAGQLRSEIRADCVRRSLGPHFDISGWNYDHRPSDGPRLPLGRPAHRELRGGKARMAVDTTMKAPQNISELRNEISGMVRKNSTERNPERCFRP